MSIPSEADKQKADEAKARKAAAQEAARVQALGEANLRKAAEKAGQLIKKEAMDEKKVAEATALLKPVNERIAQLCIEQEEMLKECKALEEKIVGKGVKAPIAKARISTEIAAFYDQHRKHPNMFIGDGGTPRHLLLQDYTFLQNNLAYGGECLARESAKKAWLEAYIAGWRNKSPPHILAVQHLYRNGTNPDAALTAFIVEEQHLLHGLVKAALEEVPPWQDRTLQQMKGIINMRGKLSTRDPEGKTVLEILCATEESRDLFKRLVMLNTALAMPDASGITLVDLFCTSADLLQYLPLLYPVANFYDLKDTLVLLMRHATLFSDTQDARLGAVMDAIRGLFEMLHARHIQDQEIFDSVKGLVVMGEALGAHLASPLANVVALQELRRACDETLEKLPLRYLHTNFDDLKAKLAALFDEAQTRFDTKNTRLPETIEAIRAIFKKLDKQYARDCDKQAPGFIAEEARLLKELSENLSADKAAELPQVMADRARAFIEGGAYDLAEIALKGMTPELVQAKDAEGLNLLQVYLMQTRSGDSSLVRDLVKLCPISALKALTADGKNIFHLAADNLSAGNVSDLVSVMFFRLGRNANAMLYQKAHDGRTPVEIAASKKPSGVMVTCWSQTSVPPNTPVTLSACRRMKTVPREALFVQDLIPLKYPEPAYSDNLSMAADDQNNHDAVPASLPPLVVACGRFLAGTGIAILWGLTAFFVQIGYALSLVVEPAASSPAVQYWKDSFNRYAPLSWRKPPVSAPAAVVADESQPPAPHALSPLPIKEEDTDNMVMEANAPEQENAVAPNTVKKAALRQRGG